jgi:hypothetical protein
MKYGQLILGVLVGAVGMHILHKMGYMSKKKEEVKEQLFTEDVTTAVYSEPLKKNYDIVLKPNKYTQKVKEDKARLTKGRYMVDLNKVKDPVII